MDSSNQTNPKRFLFIAEDPSIFVNKLKTMYLKLKLLNTFTSLIIRNFKNFVDWLFINVLTNMILND